MSQNQAIIEPELLTYTVDNVCPECGTVRNTDDCPKCGLRVEIHKSCGKRAYVTWLSECIHCGGKNQDRD